ncbi:MAG: phosphotransferase [Polyangiaceae bacterium]
MSDDLAWIAAVIGARLARRGERIQSLWSGYGELFRVALEGGPRASAVVKCARPPHGARDGVGDARKRRSYQVEQAFYDGVSTRCDQRCRVAQLLGRRARDGEWIMVLEDLDAAGFPERRRRLGSVELGACLRWLAELHARFLGEAPARLWEAGTYWHLGTRREELARIADAELRAAAPVIDGLLEAAAFRTIVHGDAKEANFCFAAGGNDVAAVDFQYAGGGCGMKDVAYLLHDRDDEPEDGIADAHLDAYFGHLRTALGRRPGRVDADAVEREWRGLYPLARADFCRFLAGWAPDHWQRDARGQRFVRRVLRDLGGSARR